MEMFNYKTELYALNFIFLIFGKQTKKIDMRCNGQQIKQPNFLSAPKSDIFSEINAFGFKKTAFHGKVAKKKTSE